MVDTLNTVEESLHPVGDSLYDITCDWIKQCYMGILFFLEKEINCSKTTFFRLIVINEICQISRKKLDFAK